MRKEKEQLTASDWITELTSGRDLSPAQVAALTDWLRESPTNVRALIEHTFISRDLAKLSISKADLDAWVTEGRADATSNTVSLAGQLNREGTASREAGDAHRRATEQEVAESSSSSLLHSVAAATPTQWPRTRILFAATLLIAILSGATVWYSRIGVYTTGLGEQRVLTLDDGSIVTLNAKSQIKVAYSEHKRSIKLASGEAFFQVAHDSSRPFFVAAQDAIVRAVGTQFDVEIAPRDTIVKVVDGVVKISLDQIKALPSDGLRGGSRGEAASITTTPAQQPSDSADGGGLQVTLTRGEEARVARTEDGSQPPQIKKTATLAALHAAAWTQSHLEFDATPLGDVFVEFQRYRDFDVKINNESIRDMKITGSFESHDPESMLAYIASMPGLAVERTGPHSYVIRQR
jgi:transmembrane sensor